MNDKTTLFFKALSDINRLRILKALQARVLCVCEIRELLGLANSTVSQHLGVLKKAGFIIEEKEGKWVNYMINPRPSDPRINTLLASFDLWLGENNAVISDKIKIQLLDRKFICCT